MNILVVNFHYVTDEVFPHRGIVPVGNDEFKSIIEDLIEEREPISLRMILQWTQEGKPLPEHGFMVTFDDGLQCQFANAEPILKALGVEAAYFANTQHLVSETLLPVHKLHLIRSQFASADLLEACFEKLGRRYGEIVERQLRASQQYRYDDDASRSLKYLLNFVLSPSESAETINWLFERYELTVPADFYLSKEAMRELAAQRKLGAHSHCHYPLGRMSPSDVIEDLQLNLNLLQEVCGTDIFSISYPFGGKDALGPHVTEAVRKVGISVGFTMERRPLTSINEPLLLPRFDVRDLYANEKMQG